MKRRLFMLLACILTMSLSGQSLALEDPNPSTLKVALLPDEDASTVIKDNEGLKIALNLSYIEKPGEPDVYQLQEGDF